MPTADVSDLTQTWPLLPSIVGLVASGLVIVIAGTRITGLVDEIADRTGWGEAIAGAVLLGAATSLPGLVTLTTGALAGDASFALANPVGGILIQTVWLAIADLFYRRVNLEHAAASSANILQSVILVGLLAVPVIGYSTPTLSVMGVHPASLAIVPLYVAGLYLLRQQRSNPMWLPQVTDDTVEDEPQETTDRTMARLWTSFMLLAATMFLAGYVVGQSGLGLVEATGASGSLIGSTVTSGISSLPELVTLLAAVRIRALTLGVGDIVGGNVFDALQITVADLAYRDGPVYADAGPSGLLLLGAAILTTGMLTAGLLMRDRRGIGFEGVAIPVVYVLAIAGVAYLG
ncbi:MAG: hypothetical protein WBG89_07255 [Ornithinimicrobium sp.]